MLNASALPPIATALVCCWLTLLLWGNAMLVALSVRKYSRPQRLLCIAIILFFSLAAYIALQCSTTLLHQKIKVAWVAQIVDIYGQLPTVAIFCFCIVCTIVDLYLLYLMTAWRKTHISSSSIKEAVDNIPVGVCAYTVDGTIILKNTVMEKLCREVTGKPLLIGTEFHSVIWSGRTIEGIVNTAPESTRILRLPDDTAWSFFAETIDTCHLKCVLLTASNVTEEYLKTQALLEKQRTVQELNERLSAYNREIVSVITAKEVLSAKIKIHDELGADLLAIKQFLVKGGDKQKKAEILKLAERSIDFLLEQTKEPEHNEYDLILATAKELGVAVQVIGTLPQKQPYQHIIATAIHECLTNTLRHAGGDLLNVCVKDAPENIQAEFTNNGRQPKDEILEKGGLSDLRTLTEKYRGKMTIKVVPQFTLTISLPKEEDYYAV